MGTLVKVKVQPGQTVSFPGLCVHSLETAVATLPIQARRGRVTRSISVPISLHSWRQLQVETEAERGDKEGASTSLAAGTARRSSRSLRREVGQSRPACGAAALLPGLALSFAAAGVPLRQVLAVWCAVRSASVFAFVSV